ncbi:MAG TPA: spermidine/putrescine ABC transporter substrate-binding protein, partial [Actinomycetota bacterium]
MVAARAISRREMLRLSGAAGLGVMLVPLLSSCTDPDESKVVFLNWQDYIDKTILDDFSDESGLAVTYETYASNDELERRLILADAARRRGRQGSSFDLIVPSENLLTQLRSVDGLQELDTSIVVSLDNLAPEYRSEPFDPGNRFSVPWATGTTGIGYDSTVFDEPPDWNVFTDASVEGSMTILDETRDAFAAALFALGDDPNTTDPAAIEAATQFLIEAKAVIAGFDSATYSSRLASGELVCAQAYSSDVELGKLENPDLEFVIPPQGGLRWIDSMCIPEAAANPEGANRFIEFYLGAEISATNATTSQVDTGNEAAREFIPADVLENTVIFPLPETLESLRFTEDLGEANALYDEGW